MGHSFKNISVSAKPTFGNYIQTQDAGEYILNRKLSLIRCNTICDTNVQKRIITNTGSQGNYLLFKKNYYQTYYDSRSINKNNLNVSLITKIDLNGVPVIQGNILGEPVTCPTDLDFSKTPYYLNYTIDPSGNLFGNNVCNEYNWQNYVTYITVSIK